MLALVMGLALSACESHLQDEGVSWELACQRKQSINDLEYHLRFSIPRHKDEAVMGHEEIRFTLDQAQDIILDFRESEEKIHSITVNGQACPTKFVADHIVIPRRLSQQGDNRVEIDFQAGDQSLNRRDDYLYTLFVPDRARTAFPCFDQPNLKGRFTLQLDIPSGWKAVTNSRALSSKQSGDTQQVTFAQTEPLSTYLFAFAAGDFQYQTYTEAGHQIGAYYRETDPSRIAQLPEILHQVVFSLQWQEDFTGVKYPFQKYDLVILPGFQFGGMEHTGATFYNDNTLFLSPNPTPDEQLRRTELIAHETSHMWFGDAVTMNWFDDVWTKEVFANYFAAEITAPLFPDIDHELNWLKTYVGAAVSQDRTLGRTSIRQPLDNLRNAGLIYNPIIYNKAPVMLRKMVDLMGKDAFRRGIQKYVQKYLYGNATWPDLIAILDAETDVDLQAFSRDWVDTANWPQYQASTWDDERIGREYGLWRLTPQQARQMMRPDAPQPQSKAHRQALLMNLYENYLAGEGNIGDSQLLQYLMQRLQGETDALTASTLINYMQEPLRMTLPRGEAQDTTLWHMTQSHPMPVVRTGLLRLLASLAQSPAVIEHLHNLWLHQQSDLLSANDYTTLAYELAVRRPRQATEILSTQRQRITDPDRLRQFDFISRAVNPDSMARDSLFQSLAQPENRRIEPWTRSVLYYLNHPLRQQQALHYIRPALELLPEIQRTGDIFFPADWCNSLLSGHRSQEAYDQVMQYLDEHPSLSPLLRNKVLSAVFGTTPRKKD